MELEKLDLTASGITEAQKAKLKSLFPEVFTEGGKVDFDRLKETLEVLDTGKERYGLNWPGKADCFNTIQMSSAATLMPAPSECVNFDTTGKPRKAEAQKVPCGRRHFEAIGADYDVATSASAI